MKQSNHLKNYISYCSKEKTLSSKTIKAYMIDINQFMEFLNCNNKVHIEEATKLDIKNYIHSLQDNYKIKSVKRKVASLKAFYNYLVYEEVIEVSPFQRLKLRLKEPFKLPTVLSPDEISSILSSLNDEYIKSNLSSDYKSYAALRNKVVIELLLNTGLRVSELCSLKVNDVSLDTKYIKVNGKGKKQRQIYIVAYNLIEQLKELNRYYYSIDNHRTYFFINKRHNRLSEQSVRNTLYKHASNIDKNVTPHILRHTFATILLEEGVDIVNIQHLLGHHSIVVTQIYTHVNMKKQKELLIDKLPISQLSISNEG